MHEKIVEIASDARKRRQVQFLIIRGAGGCIPFPHICGKVIQPPGFSLGLPHCGEKPGGCIPFPNLSGKVIQPPGFARATLRHASRRYNTKVQHSTSNSQLLHISPSCYKEVQATTRKSRPPHGSTKTGWLYSLSISL